jgi:SAM-dependent methyltransferase
MPDRTSYDPLLFTGTAEYYRRFRPGYPVGVFELLRDEFALASDCRVLDLGSGTGFLGIPIASLSGAEVTLMDPDPGMLEQARIAASEAGAANVSFVQGSSWELGPHPGSFRLAVIGRAFHWMDRVATLAALDPLVERAGGVALIAEEHRHDPLADSYGFAQAAIDEVRATFLGPQRLAGSGTYGHPVGRHEVVLAASTFGQVTHYFFQANRTWTVDQLVGLTLSGSNSSPRLLGDRVPEFKAAVRERLLQLDPRGVFDEVGRVEVVIGRRPGE